MSPRAAGAVLIAASMCAGVVAGWLLPVPPWSIAAALLLTAATIGMLVGLLWLFRRGWDDRTWPPAPAEVPDDVRARRVALRLGVFLLSTTPALLALVVWSTVNGAGLAELLRPVLSLVGCAVIGVVLVRAGLSRRAPVTEGALLESDGEEADVSASTGGDWVTIGQPGLLSTAVMIAPAPLLLILVSAWNVSGHFVHDPVLGVVVGFGALLVVAAVIFAYLRTRTRSATVSVRERAVRVGRKTLPWRALTSAQLLVSTVWPGSPRTLVLLLEGEGVRVAVVLRRRGRAALSRRIAAIMVQVMEHSAVELPRAKEDPHGRFSTVLFPTHLTREQTIGILRDPPGDDEPLPIRRV